MNISTLCLGELGTNCYVIETDEKNAVLIDPASDSKEIIYTLKSKGLELKKILITHGHFDHMMAVTDIVNEIDVPVYIHTDDKSCLTSTTDNLYAYFPVSEAFKAIPKALCVNNGDIIVQDELEFKVLHTPGHSKGSVCYICGDVMFSGDTLFSGSIGRTDPPFGDYSVIMKSIKKITELTTDYKIYPGHGSSTTLNNERQNNIYLADFNQI